MTFLLEVITSHNRIVRNTFYVNTFNEMKEMKSEVKKLTGSKDVVDYLLLQIDCKPPLICNFDD